MLDLMVCCGELCAEDVADFRKGGAEAIAVPTAPAAAVAETESQAMGTAIETKVDDETYEAMCWASGLKQTAHVLGLIHSLPPEIVNEQVLLYRDRKSKPAVAEPNAKITVTSTARYQIRSVIAAAFHAYCRHHGLDVDARMPRDAVTNFIRTRIEWKGKGKPITGRNVRRWHATWSADPANAAKKEAGDPNEAPKAEPRYRIGVRNQLLKQRVRAKGGGRHSKAEVVRKELYEWWAGIRYAIDWKAWTAERRSRGKACLARFPRYVLRAKVNQFLEDHAYATLLNGHKVESFIPTSHWFVQWEEEYGLSLRRANRKYEVARPVVKERFEIFYIN